MAKASANQLDAEPIYPPPVHLNNGEAITGHLNDITLGRNVKGRAGEGYYLGEAAPRLCARDCATTCGSTDSR